MVTKLNNTLRREIAIDDVAYVVAIDLTGLKLTVKGRRKGVELRWKDLASGDAGLAAALQASVDTETSSASADTGDDDDDDSK